ncbi:dihydroneopterin aldolase [Filimonas lacunae]|uniref:7,8-dihydroneopterin aldolase n=1 Tax=Filimonas lacunae TaxID=477680 RepID=A0A173MFJ4_9BACT|nr:dihydroneopterin aldolase [Filimonas lacunae]BAV06394.1 dihydroneopterin aldolase [Filimonas lacunae]SIT26789.1 dihydroneopterin aldolase [Filimonas lacunae]
MLTIHLQKLRFFATHGLYAEETIAGNAFEVDAIVHYQPARLPVTRIADTVDYTRIYQVIADRMKQPTALLETIVYNIANDIIQEFALVQEVHIILHKQHLPVVNFSGSVSVQYRINRKDQQTQP